jgi:hypothetical protein
LSALGACGRVGFEPPGGDGGSTSAPPGDVCATAVDIALGVMSEHSVGGASDDYPAGFCGNGPDIILRVTAPSSSQRFARAVAPFDVGLMAATSCPPPVGSCSKLGAGQGSGAQVSIDLVAGVNYIVVDRGAGTGTTFSLLID